MRTVVVQDSIGYLTGMAPTKDTASARKQRVKKRDWLTAALELLVAGGIEAVRVERLASKLGVAKSGFYYHFRDRPDLYDALLQHWLDLDQEPIKKLAQHPDASPAEQLRIIAEFVDRADLSRYDFSIRQWARQDRKVRRVWLAEMKKRIGPIRDAFERLGFVGAELEMRTRLYVAYHVSERDLFPDLSSADRTRVRELRLELLISR